MNLKSMTKLCASYKWEVNRWRNMYPENSNFKKTEVMVLISNKLLTNKRNNDKWVTLSERQNNFKYVCPQ